MLKNKRLIFIFLVVAIFSHGLVLLYSDDIKRFLFIKDSLVNSEYYPIYKNSDSGIVRYQVQVGVLLPDEILTGDDKIDSNLAKSFLSEKIDWYFVDKSRLPRFTGLGGMGYGFRSISTIKEVILE